MSVLPSEMELKTRKVITSSLDGCFLLESNWRKAVLKTEKIRKEYTTAFGLEELKECIKMTCLPELPNCQRSLNPSPWEICRRLLYSDIEMPKVSYSYKSMASHLEPLYSPLPAVQHPVKEEACQNRLKNTSETYTGIPPHRQSKYSVFRDPFTGAPPQYLQRLSKMAVLEYDTIRQETSRKFKKGKKHALRDC